MLVIQRSLLALALSLILLQSHASAPVDVIALYKDRAVVRHDGDQAMLKVGETSKFGVTLLSADPHTAKIRFEERLYELKINNKVSTRFKTPSVRTVRLNEDSLGQYRSRGSINKQYVSFLVDTGASAVALSQRQADQLGIDYSQSRTGAVQTAQGVADAFFLKLDNVTLGGITVRGVNAMVISGEYPTEVLLGMSFLNKVKMQNEGGVLVLTARS
ncbi:MAG: aspartyl protease family protein [Limisphaerales bacterium]|jgi:aspartyl protease family protein